jgi:hypothetical protein
MISLKTIEFYAYRATGTEKHSIFRGGPVKFRATLDNSIDLTGCTSLRLDIRRSVTDTESPLASEEITSFSGTVYDFEFSTAQTNHDVESAWLVLSAFYPEGAGDTDDNLDPLYIAELTVVPHNASSLLPSPPEISVCMTRSYADTLYLSNSGAGLSILGRYSTGSGAIQSISVGSGLYLSSGAINASGVSSISWGVINGSLSSQSDLWNELLSKQNSGANLTSISSYSFSNTIPYYQSPGVFSSVSFTSGIGFSSGILSFTGQLTTPIGNKGDITVSIGDVWTINSSSIDFGKIQNIHSGYILGRTGAGSGAIEELLASQFGLSLLAQSSASLARNVLGVDQSGTDNSIPVTLSGGKNYLSLSGQNINLNYISLVSDVTGNLSVGNLNGGLNAQSNSWWRGDGYWTGIYSSNIVDASEGGYTTDDAGKVVIYNNGGALSSSTKLRIWEDKDQNYYTDILGIGDGSANEVQFPSTGLVAMRDWVSSNYQLYDPYLTGATGNLQDQINQKITSGSLGSAAYVDTSYFSRRYITGFTTFNFGVENYSVSNTINNTDVTLTGMKSCSFIPIPSGITSIDDFAINGLSFQMGSIVDFTSFDLVAVAANRATSGYTIKYLIEI